MEKFIIFNTEQDAISLNNKVSNSLSPLWVDGITNTYSIIRKHPTQDLWSVIIDNNYIQYFTQGEIDSSVELTEDWNPPIILQ